MAKDKKGSRGYGWLFLFGIVIGVAMAIAVKIFDQLPVVPNDAGNAKQLTPASVPDLVHRARVAVGQLENDRFADADKTFTELLIDVPDEPMVVRNAAIARLKLFEDRKIDEAQMTQALDALQKVEPGAASTFWISAKFKLKLAELANSDERRIEFASQGMSDLQRAADSEPNNVVFPFQLYWQSLSLTDEANLKKGTEGLKRAYEIQPDNLFVLTEMLATQAKNQDATIRDTIEQAKKVLAPLARSIEVRTRVSVLKMLDQATAAAAMGNWSAVRQNLPPVGVIRSEEISRSDLRRVDVSALEFVVHEFSPRFREQHPLTVPTAPQTTIAFRAAELGEVGAALTDVLDVRIADFDLNDKTDLLVLRASKLEVYEFTEQGRLGSLIAAVDVPANLTRILIADLDQDTIPKTPATKAPPSKPAVVTPGDAQQTCFQADGDVVLYGPGGLLVLRNDLADEAEKTTLPRTLAVVTDQPSIDTKLAIRAATLVDLDHDGDLDIVAATPQGIRLWSNRGKLLFEDLTAFSILPPADIQFETLSIVDFDRDVDIDIFLSGNNATQVGYLESLRHGQFRWQPLKERFSNLGSSLAILPLEADGVPSWDLASAGESGIQVALTKTVPAESVLPIKDVIVSRDPFQQLLAADFDNNGWRDLLVWKDTAAVIFPGSGQGQFAEPLKAFGTATDGWQRFDVGDTDRDGDVDAVQVANQKLVHWVNESGNRGAYLSIHAHGDEDNRSGRVNHWAIGSLVELKAGGLYQAQTITSDATHFGLGAVQQADLARILWTQGIPQAIVEPALNQIVCEPMVLKGSCPYAYTWTGERFEFFTDLLWAAPIGLQLADGVVARDRPWEYLKIPGDRFKLRNGGYELQITEELWEAAYFDQVELIAVDHPPEIEIVSNEKVGPPSIAEFRIHTVRHPQPLVGATDQKGRDLLSALAAADGQMAKAFDTTLRQGLAEPHYVELNLGTLGSPSRIMLFLTGWIRPTDTSLNVALSHDPELSVPRAPAIWTPGPDGQWREVVAFMGFPGGKTKTIAVDISKIFSNSDYRMRIVTSNEIYWDEAFFTVDEEPGRVELNPLKLVAADLHYRGFSAALPGPRELPETYDYAKVDHTPRWPPMQGRFTRYGDVRELLTDSDARLVVMASGDEMTLRFAAPANEPLPGWKRDFILHNVGWDKDADLNTIFGQTVEPLPFVGMESYPYLDHHQLDNDLYREYLRRYQNRIVNRKWFWNWRFETQ